MLSSIDLSKKLERDEYREQLLEFQLELRRLAYDLYTKQRSLVVVFQGWDAAGKGGAIRRVIERLDPRGYHVYPIGAPGGEDLTHHYLWRFWRRMKAPTDRQIVVFDRSWYGRVLVERVEGFASEDQWKRAYREINQFEHQLVAARFAVVKFWLHISPEEQLRRFESRRDAPHKAWKLTDEDWRNREKWKLYEKAVEDMLIKTSTPEAPWTVVEAEDKYYGRVKVVRTLVETLRVHVESDDGR